MRRRIRDVMTREVVTVNEHTPFKEITQLLTDCRIGALPVLDTEARVVGVVSEADLLLKEEYPGASNRLAAEQRHRRELGAKANGATAVELMTAPAITITPDASLAEAARLPHRHQVKRLPVLDPAGPLVGIVSRGDLLKVFLRSDDQIAQEVRQDVLRRALWVDPDTVGVEVRDGVVTLTGQLERRSLIPIAVRLVHGLDGVVDVVCRMGFELDLIDRATGARRSRGVR